VDAGEPGEEASAVLWEEGDSILRKGKRERHIKCIAILPPGKRGHGALNLI